MANTRRDKYTIDEIKKIFELSQCELLESNYVNNNQVLHYKCACGAESTTRLRSVLSRGGHIQCKTCATTAMMHTMKEKGGHHFNNPDFIKDRRRKMLIKFGAPSTFESKVLRRRIEETNINRYGVSSANQSPVVRARQIESLVQNYGVEFPMQSIELQKRARATLMRNHGVTHPGKLTKSASAISQRLFWDIYRELPDEHRVYFYELSGEYCRSHQDFGTFKYDFVNTTTKTFIEFNGDKFHPKPDLDDCATGWCPFHPEWVAKDIRIKELTKFQLLEIDGFKGLVVWESQYKQDPELTLKQCLAHVVL